ncbi:hypothetical protein MKK88_04680 [Methylobacterium sp. E-005]|uniref:hypothetical protein n=1 Tax=Methylobacterium sp. E-005 TaxID=2836549 RepID=UPI001FB9D6D5|nr:hypothetical protein [Methylobacterium sp. E-005]MCJ2085292.1 hypothetical protein [Methylobacterium sp. E-005]
MGYEDVEMATAGEERDAVLRSLAEDMADAGGRMGFIRAERPRDVARVLSRAIRARRPQRTRAA